jgi:hypothetical protein
VAQIFPVQQDEIDLQYSHITHNVSGAFDAAADLGKAVTLDPATPYTVKLAGNGDFVFGQVKTYEDRKGEGIRTANVARHFVSRLPIDPANPAVGIGATVVGGATPGTVKAAGTPNHSINCVVALATYAGVNYAIVQKLS